MVVVTVIAILSTLMAPSLIGSFAKAELQSESQKLYDTARYAQRMAVLKNRTIRLVIIANDPDQNGRSSYHLELATTDLNATDSFTKVTGGSIKPTTLPTDIRIEDTLLDTDPAPDATPSAFTPPHAAIRFFPDGSADAAVIILTDNRNLSRVRSILVAPHTGRIGLTSSRITSPPNLREDLDA